MFSLYQHFCWRAFCKPFAFVLAAAGARSVTPCGVCTALPIGDSQRKTSSRAFHQGLLEPVGCTKVSPKGQGM